MSDSPLGREIFRTYDEFGPIQVFDDGELRYLSFGEGEEQSCMAPGEPHILQHDYTRAMLLGLLFCQPRDVLLLGLGGGALASALWHALPLAQITAVELRRAVIKAAQRYFELPRDSRLAVINDDAAAYVDAAPAGSVDLLCSDLYGGDSLDLQLFQPWFIEACARLLRPGGWLVLNCWRDHRHAAETLDCLHTLFDDVRSCATPGGNWIILASARREPRGASELAEAARDWSRRLGFSLNQPLRDLRRLSESPCTSN
jgi:spermidine synthase